MLKGEISVRGSMVFALLASALALAAAPAALAMTVTTTADDATTGNGSCSLREAIAAASTGSNSADCGPAGSAPIAIAVPQGTYTLTAGQLTVPSTARIEIVGANPNAPALTTIDADGHSRVMEIAAAASVTLSALRITGGQALAGLDGSNAGESGGFGGNGGGILNDGGLTLEHVWVTDNFTGHGGRGSDGDQPAASSYRYGQGGGSGGNGGGIYNALGASLSATASKIAENGTGDGGNGGNGAMGQLGLGKFPYGSDGGDGGPAGSGGGIFNEGSATLLDTTVEANFTGRGGNGGPGGEGVGEAEMQPAGRGGYGGNGGSSGVAYNIEQGTRETSKLGGGGIYDLGSLEMRRSAIVGNSTGAGGNGGGAGLGGSKLNGTETGSKAGPGGGGGLGGGLMVALGEVKLINVTVAENLTGDGGKGGNGPNAGSLGPGPGGFGGNGGGIWSEGAHSPYYLELNQVTVATNGVGAAGPPGDDASFPGTSGERGKGAGIATGGRYDGGTGAGVYLRNTVIADNGSIPAGDVNCVQYYPPDQYIDIKDLGNSLTYPGSSCPGTVADPLLGPLQDNGGLTETMLPEADSGAIGLVPLASCAIHEDQRGYPRPGGSGNCDAGAVETGSAPGVTTTATSLTSAANPATPGQSVKYTATVSPQPSGGNVSFADGGNPIPGCEAVSIGSGGQASCAVSYSTVGSHSIVAKYGGNGLFATSTSSVLTETVQNAESREEGGVGGTSNPPSPGVGSPSPPPSPQPGPKPLHCPKSKKKVVRGGQAKCVAKHRAHKKKKKKR